MGLTRGVKIGNEVPMTEGAGMLCCDGGVGVGKGVGVGRWVVEDVKL